MSAAQRVLVDRELRRRRQVLRVHQHQHAHVGIDLGRRLIERPEVEELLRLAVHRPGLAHLAGLRIEARAHRQRRQPGHHRFPGVGELINELDDVVLEELLLVVIEPLDGRAAVGGVGAGQAEVERRPGGSDRSGAHTELGGPVLLLGEGLRIDRVQPQLAARAGAQLLEEIAHPRAVGLELRQLSCGLLREEEVQVNGLFCAGEDTVGSGRDGVEAVLRQIQPPAAQRVVAEDGESDEQQREREERAAAECRTFVHGFSPPCAARARSRSPAGRTRSASRSTAGRVSR